MQPTVLVSAGPRHLLGSRGLLIFFMKDAKHAYICYTDIPPSLQVVTPSMLSNLQNAQQLWLTSMDRLNL